MIIGILLRLTYACRSCFMSAYLSEESQRPFTLLMTFNNHFSISYLRNTLSFCRWCLRHLLFDQSVKRQLGITGTGSRNLLWQHLLVGGQFSSHPIIILVRILSTTPIDFASYGASFTFRWLLSPHWIDAIAPNQQAIVSIHLSHHDLNCGQVDLFLTST